MSKTIFTNTRARIGLIKLDKNMSSIILQTITIIIFFISTHSDYLNFVDVIIYEKTKRTSISSRTKEIARVIVFAMLQLITTLDFSI